MNGLHKNDLMKIQFKTYSKAKYEISDESIQI